MPAGIGLGRLAEFEPPLAHLSAAGRTTPLDGRARRGAGRQEAPAERRTTAPAASEHDDSEHDDAVSRAQNLDVARQLLNAVCEVLDGRRPLQQVGHLLSARVQEAIRTRVRRRGAAGAALRLRTVRTCSPAPGVIEACATLACGPRVRAAAVRIETHHGSWRCTALRVLCP
jgi:hypothetical protein